MNLSKTKILILSAILYFVSSTLLLVKAQIAHPQQTAPTANAPVSYVCTQHKLNNVSDAPLTKQERLAKMQNNLQDSIDQYSTCMSQVQGHMSNARQNANGGSSGQGGSGNANAENLHTGTQETVDSQNQGQHEVNTDSQTSTPQNTTQQEATMPPSPTGNTPVKREITPPKDNASIICQLLWDEIQQTDGDRKSGFEKQYRDYNCS